MSVENKHHLLSAAHGWDRDNRLSALLQCAVDDVDEIRLHLSAARHNILLCAVGALHNQRLNTRVIPCCAVKQQRLTVLEISSVNNVVRTFTDVKMNCRGA